MFDLDILFCGFVSGFGSFKKRLLGMYSMEGMCIYWKGIVVFYLD